MFGYLALLVTAGLLGPLLAAGRRGLVPVLVGELIAGAVLGRSGFGVLDPASQPLPVFSLLGFAMLMLGAGTEVDIASPGLRRGVARGALAFLVVLAVGVPFAFFISGWLHAGHLPLLAVLLAGSSAAVAFPIILEHGLSGPAVDLLIGWITIADAATALLMPLTLTGPGKIPGALAGDAAIVIIVAAVIAIGAKAAGAPLVKEFWRESIERRWAVQLRLSVLLLLVLASIAELTGASLLVAGFAAGIVLRRFHESTRIELQLSGVANGFFVPAFFVLLGATINLRALLGDPSAIALALAMAVAATCAHLAGSLVVGRERRVASGLLASAQLGLPAAAASLALATHLLSPAFAAALVAGGVLTLVPATVGGILLSKRTPGAALPSRPAGSA